MKYTRGSWRAVRKGPADLLWIEADDGKVIAMVLPTNDEQEHDGRLIVAAPEMHVACRGALAALLLGPHVDKQQAIDYLKSVLLKVEGNP